MITPQEVVTLGRSLVGTPYRHQGRTRQSVDCIGLIVLVSRELGLLDAERFIPANYSPRPRDGLLEKYVREVCIEIAQPVAGSMALFRWAQTAPPAHCALMSDVTMIHSYRTVGRVVEHRFAGKWPERVHSFYLLPGVEYSP